MRREELLNSVSTGPANGMFAPNVHQVAGFARWDKAGKKVVMTSISEASSQYRGVKVPLWFVCLTTAAYPAVRLRRWLRTRREARRGRCPSCGYDLRATPARCPECGREPRAVGRAHPAAK